MKKILIIIMVIFAFSFLIFDIIRIRISENELPQEYILLDESIYFRGEEELILNYDFEIGDIIIFEIYPQADVLGFWFVIIYDGNNSYHYEYQYYFREIDQNNVYVSFDVILNENEIIFTNSLFHIEDESGFWIDRDLPTVYEIPTYLRKIVIYK